jgi:hypothetical protein
MDRPTLAPAPWTLTGNATILLYHFPRQWAVAQGLVPGELRDRFVGGVGGVVLADYTASGVGPYGEALFIPGLFRVGGRPRFVITRIYVSTPASVDSGRANWGIPKELGDVEAAGDTFRVALGPRPILDAEVAPLGPHLPADTGWLPAPLELGQIFGGRRYVTRLSWRGAVRLARLRHFRADPDAFPDVSPFRPLLAARLTGFVLTFPEAKIDDAGA